MPLCPGCALPVDDIDVTALTVFGRRYHREHFACCTCGLPLAGKPFYDSSSSPMCCACYESAHSIEPCGCGCGSPLLGAYVSAMGKKILQEHFVCSDPSCSVSLLGGYMEADGEPVCETHWKASRNAARHSYAGKGRVGGLRAGEKKRLSQTPPSSSSSSAAGKTTGGGEGGEKGRMVKPELAEVTAQLKSVLGVVRDKNAGGVLGVLKQMVAAVKALMAALSARAENGVALADQIKAASAEMVRLAKVVVAAPEGDEGWRNLSLATLQLGTAIRNARDNAHPNARGNARDNPTTLSNGASSSSSSTAPPPSPSSPSVAAPDGRRRKTTLVKTRPGLAAGSRHSRALPAQKKGPLPKSFREYAEYHDLDISTFSKNQVACQEVIYEMIQTEEAYVLDLLVLIDEFVTPLRDSRILGEEDVDALFCNVEEIVPLHRQMWLEFKKRQKEKKWVDCVGDILSDKLRRMLVAYTPYSSNHANALSTLERLTGSSKKFRAFLETQMENPRTKGIPLGGYLIKPIQRLCKYPLLLRELLKKMDPATDADYDALVETAENLGTVVARINEWKRTTDSLANLARFQSLLDDPDSLLPPDLKVRNYVMDGEVSVGLMETSSLKRNSSIQDLVKPKKHLVFLFSGLLVLGTPKKRRKGRVVSVIDLDSVHLLENLPIITDVYPHSIAIAQLGPGEHAGRVVILVFDDGRGVRGWEGAITNMLEERGAY